MRIPLSILLLGFACASVTGCSQSAKTPGSNQPAYPVAIKDSAERRDRAERDWKRMLYAYNIPEAAPDFYPITWTPKSLPGVGDSLKIMGSKAAKETQASALREAAKSFVQRWQELTVAEPSGISLTEESQTGGLTKLTYKEMSYPFPIAGNFGVMTLTLSSDGILRQLDDRFIPVVDLPARPLVDRDTAIGSVVGQTVPLAPDSSGKSAQVKVARKIDIATARLVVLPIETKNTIELHLAWQLTGAQPSQWTAYVDAVNGGLVTTTRPAGA